VAYKVGKLSLSKYFEQQHDKITAIENWQHKTDEIVLSVQAVAPDIPLATIRTAFVRQKRTWMAVDAEVFAKHFVEE